MIEVEGNIWEAKCTFICITTNGDVKKNGELVMGRGVAQQCVDRDNSIAKKFGDAVNEFGNLFIITPYMDMGRQLVLFPVKHHWRDQADLNLIQVSIGQLYTYAATHPDMIWALPRPGCGNGRLQWKDIKPLVENLPDNVHIYHWPGA